MRLTKVALITFALLALLPGCVFPASGGTPTTPPDPRAIDPGAVVLHWSRMGGIAGFCDDLTIYGDGTAVAVPCTSSSMPDPQPIRLDEWAQLEAWLYAYAPYTDVMSDDAVADSMTVLLEFNGVGTGEAKEMEMQSIMEFAARIYGETYAGPTAVPTAAGPCLLTADSDVTVYSRPSLAASVFGVLAAGEALAPLVQSTESWYGFDPGVAQAGNVGIFRNRWVPPDADVTVSGDCASLPVAPVVSATACYIMAMGNLPVYSAPDSTSSPVFTLPFEGFAPVTGVNASGWYLVDLNDSSHPQDAMGWISPADASFNGPCGSLPALP